MARLSMATDTIIEDRKKRTMAALERRFTVAKAELELHQKKTKRTNQRFNEEQGNQSLSEKSTSLASITALANESLTTSSRKGNFTFSGYSNSEELDDNDPSYLKLSKSIHENLMIANGDVSSRKESKVDRVLHDIFQKGDSSQKYMQGSRNRKIDNWVLLDNYVQGRRISTGSSIRALKIHSKRSKKHMSMKQLKKHGLLDLPKEFHKYEILMPKHDSWKNYMMQLLKKIGKYPSAQCFLDADLHGAIISVADCKITSLTGLSGIIIRETAETFAIVTQDDKFRVVPKKFSVFVFQIDCWKVTLLGDKLASRNKPPALQT